MKFHSIWAVLALTTALTSCSKDGDDAVAPNPGGSNSQIPTPPASFGQNVLLEYHTAAWCGACPDAATKRDQLMNTYPGRVIPVEIHQSDGMQIPGFFTLDANFGSSTGYGMVSRIPSLNNVLLNRTQWLSNTTGVLNRTATAGLAIFSTVTGTTAVIEVQGAFKSNQTGTYNITVWLTENDVTGTGAEYDQVNDYNTSTSSPWYNLGNPIVGYKHQYVWRKAVTPVMGEEIPGASLVAGGLIKKFYTVDITGMNKDNVYIVAFINKVGTSPTTHEVINVQRARLGTLQNWN